VNIDGSFTTAITCTAVVSTSSGSAGAVATDADSMSASRSAGHSSCTPVSENTRDGGPNGQFSAKVRFVNFDF
jgi:hypothetical protein